MNFTVFRRKIALHFVIAVLCLCAHNAVADQAMDKYNLGVKLYNAERFDEAAEAFRAAYDLKPAWKLYYNIGQAEAAARRYGSALDAFEAYLVEGGDNIGIERRESVLREIQNFKLLVGVVEVDAPAGSKLYVDNAMRSEIPLKGILRVAAGEHRFVLKLNGDVLLDENFKVAGEEKLVLSPKPKPGTDTGAAEEPIVYDRGQEGPTEEPAPEKTSQMNAMTGAGIGVGVAGLASASVGIVFFIKGRNEFDKAEAQDDKTEFDKWNQDYEKHNVVGISLMAAGGALTVAGVVLLVIGLRDKNKGKEKKVSILPAPGGLAVRF